VERVQVFCLLLDFAHESRRKRREHKLDGGAIVTLVVLVVQHELFSAESLGGLDRVTRVAFDDVRHQQFVFGVGKVRDAVHSAIGEMIPNCVLEINKTAGRGKGGRQASAAVVVTFLRCAGVDRSELVWGSEFIAGAWIETDPTGERLPSGPGGPVVSGERDDVTHDGFYGSVGGDGVTDRCRRRGGDGVTSRSRRRHLGLTRCVSWGAGSNEHGVLTLENVRR